MAFPSRFSSNALLALILLLTFGAQVYSATTENPLISIYEKWISDFGRVYKSNAEKQQRFEVFQKNYQFIQSMKNQPDLTYTVDLNEFADLTNEEFLTKYVGFKTKKPIHSEYANFTAAPTCIDWRSLGAVTPVQNQGSCGGSWAFSATGSIESICKIKTGTLINLSEVDLIHCCNSSCGCNGASVDCAFQCVIQNLNGCITPNCDYTSACKCRICSYQDVTPYCESCLKNAVANQPVSAVIDVSGLAFQLYSSGIFTGPCGTNLNHAVLIVGYGPCSTGTSYWIVKNSWGTSWGESGYMRMQRNVASTAGLCGVAIEPSYPNMC